MNSVTALRKACAALPQSQETFPFGLDTLVLKVGGKIYALCGLNTEPPTLSLKVRPERGDELRAAHSAITAGYHFNKRHWITLPLGGLPDDLSGELLRASYGLVVRGLTKAQRAELGL
ncbi:MmcQ/YjbR family DNA-binding protein [Deinococcus psychrotolerans]|uniref:MmcQ/YjbR family DNA-binding protein n=1 Tax=Deinococcus psychrotolerans TaxID=2489213 RepID=A0A3G8YCD2_9DEIO|nr:MmcQ/YjbR family DNA-binding protein [Deinococcus psychrotolerans]AZI42978.1 MmcQ/YjbR family DNA-binding protein [Deinococcus psychrotolerans]